MHPTETPLKAVRAQVHPFCLVCSTSNPFGLAVTFRPDEHGDVEGIFVGHPALEGYPGLLHGGIVASLLDGAMTNCLFARGIVGLTGELRVRYWKPVQIGPEIEIRARVTGQHRPLYHLEAALKQEGVLKASGWAKFMEKGDDTST